MIAAQNFQDYVRMTEEAADGAAPAPTWAAVAAALAVMAVLGPLAVYLAWVLWWKPKREATRLADPDTMDLVGSRGRAAGRLHPDGVCLVRGRRWPCRAEGGGLIPAGTPVEIVGWEPGRFIVAAAGTDRADATPDVGT